jgi:hypothetical protein
MEAANTSKRSVNIYQITRRNNPEDSHLHSNEPEDSIKYRYFRD